MSFLKRIKMCMEKDPRGMRAPPGYTVVPDRDLAELVDHFESLEQNQRAGNAMDHEDTTRALVEVIRNLWFQNGKSPEQIMYIFARELQDLTQQKLDEEPRYNPTMDINITGEFKFDEHNLDTLASIMAKDKDNETIT